jgi:beta-lactamase regulating signal transducer with metallopeptidase domain
MNVNELGILLAWSAVQAALVLAPAAVLHLLASRRSAASGAWVAALGLGLVVATTVVVLPWGRGHEPGQAGPAGPGRVEAARPDAIRASERRAADIPATAGPGLTVSLTRLRGAWSRLERGAAAPAVRCRPWGSALAVAGLAGSGFGLLRLLVGLWAVRLCRKRGRVVADPALLSLLAELRAAMGCGRAVEVVEVPDLTTPATAGWMRPVVLLPDDWRAWDEADRRAVLAHEIAHVLGHDYAAGLVARVALVLHFYHPLVRWMAGRLHLGQELAADALGARFAGGRAVYRLALSRLALRQDGRSPCWPARAFLPARGTLIRRIAMLREESVAVECSWSRSFRVAVALGLAAVAVGVATLRGPARGDDKSAVTEANKFVLGTLEITGVERRETPKADLEPIELIHVPEMIHIPDSMVGFVAFRPAATFHHLGMSRYATMIRDFSVAELAKALKVDPSKPGSLTLGLEDIGWVTCGLGLRSVKSQKDGHTMHAMMFGGLTVRTVRPFDWLAFLRQWRCEFTEVREGERTYHKMSGLMVGGPKTAVYQPDNRTIVFDDEEAIQKLIRRDKPLVPAYLASPEWERASRGLLAVAINNHDEQFTKQYDLGRPDDAVVLSLFKGVDRWVFGVDDTDAITLHAAAACQASDAGQAIARVVESLRTLGRAAVEHPDPGVKLDESQANAVRMVQSLLTNVRVATGDRSVTVNTDGFGTLAEFASIMEAEGFADSPRHKDGNRGQTP